MVHSICQQIWKTQQWLQDWKMLVFIPVSKKRSAKECSNYHTIALISHTSKAMLKILQDKLQQYVNWELPDVVWAGFRKGRGTRDQTANIHWIREKARNTRTTYTSASLTALSFWLCGSQQTVKFFKWWEYQTTLHASWETCIQGKEATVRIRQVTMDWSMSRLYIVTLFI